MMSEIKYHINSAGNRTICKATVRSCPLGGSHLTRAELIVEQNQNTEHIETAFSQVVGQLKDLDATHYRLYLPENSTEPVVVNLQHHDYYSRDDSRFVDEIAYDDEEKAAVAAQLFNEAAAPSYMRTEYTLAEQIMQRQAGKGSNEAFLDVVDKLPDYNSAHYRMYLNRNNEVVAVNVQYFDYHDYTGSRFLDDNVYLDAEEAETAAKYFNEGGVPEIHVDNADAQNIVANQAGKSSHSAFKDVENQLSSYEEVHYRTYLDTRTNQPVTVCVQYFDYIDYSGSHFLDKTAYSTESEAASALTKYL